MINLPSSSYKKVLHASFNHDIINIVLNMAGVILPPYFIIIVLFFSSPWESPVIVLVVDMLLLM